MVGREEEESKWTDRTQLMMTSYPHHEATEMDTEQTLEASEDDIRNI